MKKGKLSAKTSEKSVKTDVANVGFNLLVCAETAQTAILLLSSPEKQIALNAIRSLCKFAEKSQTNLLMLYNLNIVEGLRQNIYHSEAGVRRYAYKLLAQLMVIPDVLTFLVQDHTEVENFVETLEKCKSDKYIQEFISSIFVKLSCSIDGCDSLLKTEILDISFQNLQSSDPDIRKNFLNIIFNILDDPHGANLISSNHHFNWESILNLVNDKYIDIQKLSLSMVNRLLSRKTDTAIQKSFKLSDGLNSLLKILESNTLKYLHSEVLDILKTYTETPDCVEHFYKSGSYARFMKQFEAVESVDKSRWLSVLLNMALIKEGREMLHKCNMEKIICDIIAGNEECLWGAAYLAATLMCRHCSSAFIMIENSIVENTLGKLQIESNEWDTVKENALILLTELFKSDKKSIDIFIDLNGHVVLKNMLLQITETSQYRLQTVLQCFLCMEIYEGARQKLLNANFIQNIIDILQTTDAKTSIVACEVVCGLMYEKELKHEFLLRDGASAVKRLLDFSDEDVRNIACILIHLTADDESSDQYLIKGVLQILIDNSDMPPCSMWNNAIDAILDFNLPAKFALKSVLEFDDITKWDFYAIKQPLQVFPDLQSLIQNETCNKFPVYLCHFSKDYDTLINSDDISKENSSLTTSSTVLLDILNQDGLTAYLKELKKSFSKMKDITCIAKVQAVAKFVCDKMSGPSPGINCNQIFVQMHQNELMANIGSNILPLETVKAGGSLERSLLFKVLSDKLGIPARLCRGDRGKSWIEVPLEIKIEYVSEFDCWQLPWKLLLPSHIVDLEHSPAQLLAIGSSEAEKYCRYP